jgi:CheY-like chemotaxis protein
MARVTVVNDNGDFLALMRDILEDERDDVTTIDGDRDDALAAIRDSRPDVLMIDLHLGSDELHGWQIAQKIRADPAFAGLPVLICSADVVALRRLDQDLETDHRVETLVKPFGLSELTAALHHLLTGPGQASSPA